MPKAKQTSLPEKDYLSILDTIKSFNQCNTRKDLKECFKDVLLPLFEAQSGLYCWVEPEQLSNTQFIDTVGISESTIKLSQEMQPYTPLNKLIVQSTRLVMAYDVDMPREVNQEGMDLFFKDHPQYKRSEHPLFNNMTTAIIAVDRPEITMGLGLHRYILHDKPFTLRDIRIMELLRPHLLQTIKTIILREEVAQYKSLSEKLADCPSPVALVRMNMLVIFLNQAFKDLLKIERGQRLPKDMIELIKKEITKYASPFETEHGGIELSFYTALKGEFRLSVNLLEGRGVEEDKRYLIRLKPAVEPYSKMNLIMQKAGLTGREMETTVLVKDGMTNQEIAGRLFISLETVKSHLQKIFQKMDVPSRTKLIAVLNKPR